MAKTDLARLGLPALLRSRIHQRRPQAGRIPTFVALEGADAILALASAVSTVGTSNPADVCAALRSIHVRGTREEFAFDTQSEGVVCQQWRWPPAVVVRRTDPRRGEPELLWSDYESDALAR